MYRIDHGTRRIYGTDWPVVSTIQREGRKWLVTLRICNGVSDGTRVFRSRREALAYFAPAI